MNDSILFKLNNFFNDRNFLHFFAFDRHLNVRRMSWSIFSSIGAGGKT